MSDTPPPVCEYCGALAERVTGAEIYAHRKDLGHKIFWRCVPCKAWVGCHLGSDRPLGRLANEELRNWKRAAHDAFDPLWRTVGNNKKRQREAKSRAYAALARELGIPREEAHIGMFDIDLCRRTVAIIEKLKAAMAQ
jgi:hypothetical protein